MTVLRVNLSIGWWITHILADLIAHFPKPNHFAKKKVLFLPREASAGFAGDAEGACIGDTVGLPRRKQIWLAQLILEMLTMYYSFTGTHILLGVLKEKTNNEKIAVIF